MDKELKKWETPNERRLRRRFYIEVTVFTIVITTLAVIAGWLVE